MKLSFFKEHRRPLLILTVILILQFATAFYFCTQKQGFHYDEYYSYYSSNVTYGLAPSDREWKNTETIASEFQVQPEGKFQYGMVKLMQGYDVHPPLYYMVLHTVCSFFPGSFSKWQGLGLNLALFVIAFVLFARLTFLLSKGNRSLTIAACALFGFQPGIISGITFIRMYMLLLVWCLAISIWHLKALQRKPFMNLKQALGLILLTFLGFMTHYYFAVFLFFMAAYTCLYLWWYRKELKTGLIYGFTVCFAMGLGVLYYPSCLAHIFRGYRGNEATAAFFDMSNTLERFHFFWQLMNDSVFGGCLDVLILLLLLLLMTMFYVLRKKRLFREIWKNFYEYHCDFFLIAFVTLGYFLVVAKTALLNAEEANRYELPVYGFCLLLILLLFSYASNFLQHQPTNESIAAPTKTIKRVCGLALTLLILVSQGLDLYNGKVQFLYPADRGNVVWASEHSTEPIVYLYNPNNLWMIWDESEELMQYKEIYFVNLADTSPIEDGKIKSADTIYVYSSRLPEAEEMIKDIIARNDNLETYEKIRELLYCDLYELK